MHLPARYINLSTSFFNDSQMRMETITIHKIGNTRQKQKTRENRSFH